MALRDKLAALLAAIDKVRRIQADLADFDGDKRGHWAALEEAEETLCDCAVSSRQSILDLLDENERLREALKPQWFYPGDGHESDDCQISVDDAVEAGIGGWLCPDPGKHVLQISTALPGPTIWAAVHVFTDEEKDQRGDDEPWTYETFSTEAKALAALENRDD